MKYDSWQERKADKHWKEFEDGQQFSTRFPRISSYWRARMREAFNLGFMKGLEEAAMHCKKPGHVSHEGSCITCEANQIAREHSA